MSWHGDLPLPEQARNSRMVGLADHVFDVRARANYFDLKNAVSS
jgi:hypothetical protein